MLILYIVLGLIVLLLSIVLVRTALFVPKKEEEKKVEELNFDREKAVRSLQTLVRFRTVSNEDREKEDNEQFEGLIRKLPELYPHVYEKCTLTRFEDRGLLYLWKGKSAGNPAILMAHYDVVPVEEANWEKPPFEGILENGVLWGRGTLDTKVTFNGVLSGADYLIGQGFQPEHDIYFAFSGGEEINGPGAIHIKDWFKEQGITPELVVDEGGAVVDHVFPGVKEQTGLIGIAEKGLLNVQYKVTSGGGHASAPGPHTPVGILALACSKVEAHPFKAHLTKPVAEMFDTLGRRSSFVYRMIFANLWLFGGVLDTICKKSGGELNAMMRTTVAFTQMEGSAQNNVIPPTATMVSNIRLNPMDTVDSAIDYLKSVVKDPQVEITRQSGMNPSRISETDCEGWNRVKNAVEGTWKGAVVAPYLMVQCSDSRYYSDISDRVYRFSAMDLTAEERHTIHGNNERIRVESLARAVEFYIRLMKQC